MGNKKIKSVLISVYIKTNLEQLAGTLNDLGIIIYSTGGTKEFIEKMGINVIAVEALTSYPSILGGRVKTLHPKVFGGILARRNNESDRQHSIDYDIPPIDMVIVDLYPFEETVASGASNEDIIENIDIGGISLIRAAAKNYNDVLVISSQKQYEPIANLLKEQKGETTIEQRQSFALEAFNISSHYDTAIFKYLNKETNIPAFKESIPEAKVLRYGENPHQQGLFFGKFEDVFDQLHGKEISYNNLLDIEAAVYLCSEFTEITCAILKHNNACGIASRPVLCDAWKDALAADPVSAFGGVIIVNTDLDADTATQIDEIFFEVVIAPSYSQDALNILMKKKNRIILIQKQKQFPEKQFRTLLNGVLMQDRDIKTETKTDMQVATNKTPTEQEYVDMEFANKVVKHTKSNTIVLVHNSQMLASGVGQTSRVDALRQAIAKADSFGFSLQGAVMASDAFFPFPDCVEIASEAGVTAIIQPGGSIKDKDSIDFCNSKNVAMVLTGTRHFKH